MLGPRCVIIYVVRIGRSDATQIQNRDERVCIMNTIILL